MSLSKIMSIVGSVLILFGIIMLIVSCTSDYEYTVKYYTEQPDGTYVETKNEVLTTPDSALNFEPATKDHYTVNASKSKLTANFKEETDVVISVYYDANRYTVTFDIGALSLDSGNLVQSIFYGEDAVAPVVSNTDKAKFLNWSTSFTDVAGNITVSAVCNTDATVKVYHQIEQKDGTYVTSLVETKTVNASLGDYIHTPAELAHYTVNTAGSSLVCSPSVNQETSVTVRYDRAAYTVRFDLSGLTHTGGMLEQTVKYGDTATLPTFADNNACIFLGWDGNTAAPIEANTVFTATVNTTARVKVTIYREQANGQFTLFETLDLDADARLGNYTYAIPSVVGYSPNTAMSTITGNLTVNQETALTVYYAINRYTVTFVTGGLAHVSGNLTQTVAHGEAAIAPTVANTASLAFVRWDNAFDSITANLTVTAVTTTDAPIKVITYKENLNGGYDKASETTVYANAALPSYTHSPASIANHTVNTSTSVLTVVPSMLETKTVEIYYDLVRYTVTFDIGDLDHIGGGDLVQTVPYGGSATAPEVSGTRTADFQKWNRSFENVTSNITVRAVVTTDAVIKITHYYEHLSGGYIKGETTTKTVSAQQATYTHAPAAEVGYNVNTTYGNSTCQLHAGKESTIEIYYDLKQYGVQFVLNGVVQTGGDLVQVVPHGGTAVAPTVANAATILFVGWDKSFDNVTDHLIINAIVEEYTPISSRADLERIALDLSGNYILTANINLSGNVWTPLGTFTGKFLGNGYTITGLSFNGQNAVGLFKKNSGIIDDITLRDCSVYYSATNHSGSNFKSSFFAYENAGTIRNCHLTGANSFTYVNNSSIEIGVFGGSADDALNWTNTYRSGGFAGVNSGLIENCRITGTLNFNITTSAYYKFNTIGLSGVALGSHTLTANCYFGGFSAENEGTIKGCTSTATIKTTASVSSDSVRNKDTSGNGRNPVTAKNNVTFGTITAINNERIESCETYVATFDRSVSADGVREYASNNFTYDSSYKTLVGTNNDTIIGSVAVTT